MVNFSTRLHPNNRIRRYYRKYIKNLIQEYKSIIFISLWVIAFFLGYYGYTKSLISLGQKMSQTDIVYMTMQLFLINYKLTVPPPVIELQIARFLAPFLMFSTIFILLATLFHDSISKFIKRLHRGHVIICGFGFVGSVLVEQFCEKGYSVIIIDKNLIASQIDNCMTFGASVICGDPNDPEILNIARVDRAKFLIAVTDDDNLNAEIAGIAATIPRSKPKITLNCYLHLKDMNLYNLLKTVEISNIFSNAFRLDLMNIYQKAGASILDRPDPFVNDAIDPSNMNLVVIGVGNIGESLILYASKSWRRYFKDTGEKLHIQLIDRDAYQIRESIVLSYPSILKYCILEAITIDIKSPEFQKGDFLLKNIADCHISRIFICLTNSSLGLETGLKIHCLLQDYGEKQNKGDIPIIVGINHDIGLSKYIIAEAKKNALFSNLYFFPIFDKKSDLIAVLNTNHEMLARGIHEKYLVLAQKSEPEKTSLLDWETLPEEYKEINRNQADHIIEKLRAINCGVTRLIDWDESLFTFTPDEIEKAAKLEHERWIKDKENKGWRWGPVQDTRWWHKRHPSMVVWDDLSESEKEKDRNAVQTLPDLLQSVDLKIIRF